MNKDDPTFLKAWEAAKKTGAPFAAFVKSWEQAHKYGHQNFAVAWDKAVPIKNLTPKQRQLARKQRKLRQQQAIADKQDLQRLLQLLVPRYGREQVIELVCTLTAPKPRPRGRPKLLLRDRHIKGMKAEDLIEEVERRRQAGSQRPVRDLYEAIFVKERRSSGHYQSWQRGLREHRRELRKHRNRLNAGEGE
jgi:hypothetical protein